MSIHVTRAPTVPLTSYDTKRSSHFKTHFKPKLLGNFTNELPRKMVKIKNPIAKLCHYLSIFSQVFLIILVYLKYFCGKRYTSSWNACVDQLFRAVDRQSKDLGSNPSAVESVFFHRKIFKFFKYLNSIALFAIYEFEIVYEDTCRQRILSDARLVILREGRQFQNFQTQLITLEKLYSFYSEPRFKKFQ